MLFTAASTKLRLLLYRSLALVEGRRLLRMLCSLLRMCIGPMPGMLPERSDLEALSLSRVVVFIFACHASFCTKGALVNS